MKYELFDPAKHKVETREIALAFDRDGMRDVALASVKDKYPDAQFPCAMRSLLLGEHDIGWGETLRVMPEDVAMCVVNGNELIRSAFFPLLFDHGFTGRGTESPGDVLECYEENGSFWQLCDLADEEMYRAACNPGKRWKSRSLGFGAWIDGDGFLRAVQPKELSLTNLPRLKGLGKVVEMSHLRKVYGLGFRPGPEGLVIPTSLAAVPAASPEGTQRAATGGEASSLSTSTSSPVPASTRKEEHMKVTPENLKLLGLAENASEDDLNRRLAELAAPAAAPPAPKPEPKVETPPPPAPGVTLGDVQKIVAESTATVFKEMAAANAKAIAEATAAAEKKAKVDGLLERAIGLGKVPRAHAKFLRPGIEADPVGFEAELAAMKAVAPVEPIFERGGSPGFVGAGQFHGFDTAPEYTHEIAQTVAALGCTVSQAIAIVDAGGLAAGEEN